MLCACFVDLTCIHTEGRVGGGRETSCGRQKRRDWAPTFLPITMTTPTHSKVEEAKALLGQLAGPKGVWASKSRYRNQCWTRDFCLALAPCLPASVQETHLDQLFLRQTPSGKIPILFLDDDLAFLREKVPRSVSSGEMSFMLKRYLEDGNLSNLTQATRDSEILFVIAALSSAHATTGRDKYHEAANRALEYVYQNNVLDRRVSVDSVFARGTAHEVGGGLLPDASIQQILFRGGDWRNNREDLEDKFTLSNACLWYQACRLAEEAKIVRRSHPLCLTWGEVATQIISCIRRVFWNEAKGYFFDYLAAPEDGDTEGRRSSAIVGNDNFDLLGNALAIEYGIASPTQINSVLRFATTHLTTTLGGFRMADTFLPALTPEEKAVMERDKAVIWPWTSGFLLLAMCRPNVDKSWHDVARQYWKDWQAKQEGFFEWYDVTNGKGYGSPDQAWTAALFLRVHAALPAIP